MYNLKITRKTISDALPISTTLPPSIIDINISNPEVSTELAEDNSHENDKNNLLETKSQNDLSSQIFMESEDKKSHDDSSLQYLKSVHSNLQNMNDDESLNSDHSVLAELKNLTKNVADAFKEEIKQRENNNS